MTADTVGGVWTYTIELCNAFRHSGIIVFLATMGAKLSEEQKEEIAALDNVRVYETAYALEWMQDPWADMETSGRWLLRLEQELQPDIIHLNSYAYGSLPWSAPVVVVAHSDVYSWWQAVHETHPPAEWTEYYSRVSAGILAADIVIAPSATVMNYMQEIYKARRCRVIYNGRSEKLFHKLEKQPYVFSAGRVWDEAKNITFLMEAAPQIACPVKIAGPNGFEDKELDVAQSQVSFLGKLNRRQIAAQLSEAAVYCLPAKYEPFGLSVLEAALSGCALVLGNIDSLREIWQDNALYVDTNNPSALAETINKLVRDESLRTAYAEKAYLHGRKFSPAAMAQQYEDVYRQLLVKKRTIQKEKISV